MSHRFPSLASCFLWGLLGVRCMVQKYAPCTLFQTGMYIVTWVLYISKTLMDTLIRCDYSYIQICGQNRSISCLSVYTRTTNATQLFTFTLTVYVHPTWPYRTFDTPFSKYWLYAYANCITKLYILFKKSYINYRNSGCTGVIKYRWSQKSKV